MNKITVSLLFFLLPATLVFGQLQLFPLAKKKAALQQRTAEEVYLELPFFDDFSQSPSLPDTLKWKPQGGTFITNSFALYPPSVNMVTFDGADQQGIAYDFVPDTNGPADSLTTQLFDLSGFSVSQQLTIGFYWMAEGLGELPNSGSALRLFGLALRNGVESWELLWEQESPGDQPDTTPFRWEEITLTDPAFFHDRFRFSFSNYGSLNGAFDNWHLDYVVFFQKVRFDPIALRDISWGVQPTSPLVKYRQMPFSHVALNPAQWVSDTVETNLLSVHPQLEVLNPPTCYLFDNATGAEISTLPVRIFAEQDGFEYGPGQAIPINVIQDPVSGLSRGERLRYSVQNTSLADLLATATDSVDWEYRMILDPLENQEFLPTRQNDTLRHALKLTSHYAYDDGTAEFAAGINQRNGRLAYQFVTAKPDLLSAIDLHVVGIGPNLVDQSFSLMIWESIDTLDERNDRLLVRQTIPIKPSAGVNQLVRYELGSALFVQDTFYIGIEQLQDDFIPIGYDLNSTSGENVFYNVASRWVRNNSLPGSLMLRPVFAANIPTGLDSRAIPGLKVFPNPAMGRVFIEGKVSEAALYHLNGLMLKQTAFEDKRGGILPLKGLQPGMYLLKLTGEKGSVVQKLIIAP